LIQSGEGAHNIAEGLKSEQWGGGAEPPDPPHFNHWLQYD